MNFSLNSATFRSGAEDDDEFTTFSNFPACSVVQTVPYAERCAYVRTTPECLEKKYYVNYMILLYCGFDPRSMAALILGVITLLSLCTIMFIILGVTADKCFCPALMMLSKTMGMNEQLAGVTMLAFGNGSPDLFTSMAGINDSSRFMYNDLFGAGIYIISFVGGLISFLHPFQLQANGIMRDVCFFLLGVVYIDYAIVSGGEVTILESVFIICIYLVYLVVIGVDQLILKQRIRYLEKRIGSKKSRPADSILLAKYNEEAGIELIGRYSRVSIDVELTRNASYNALGQPNDNIFEQFFETLNPIGVKAWQQSGFFGRFGMILKIPIVLILQLNIPICDYELDRHGWSKLLNTIQIVLLPVIISTAITQGSLYYGVPMCVYTLIITVPISLAVFFNTRTDVPPCGHFLLAFYSALGSVFVIYSCASETVQILYVLGIVTYGSNAFLGCTVLAWGNGIGDLVANVTLASYGYQKMGYAACFGGPLFNSILTMGCTFLYKSIISADNAITVNRGPLGENVRVFITLVLVTTLIWSNLTNFRARRSIGAFNLILYFLFFLYTILAETEIIQSFASDTVTAIALK